MNNGSLSAKSINIPKHWKCSKVFLQTFYCFFIRADNIFFAGKWLRQWYAQTWIYKRVTFLIKPPFLLFAQQRVSHFSICCPQLNRFELKVHPSVTSTAGPPKRHRLALIKMLSGTRSRRPCCVSVQWLIQKTSKNFALWSASMSQNTQGEIRGWSNLRTDGGEIQTRPLPEHQDAVNWLFVRGTGCKYLHLYKHLHVDEGGSAERGSKCAA